MKAVKQLTNAFKIVFSVMVIENTYSQITGTPHDFSTSPWNVSGQICLPCHTPHNALSGYSPLWNHMVTASVFTLYSTATFNGSGTMTQPDGSSKLCLSCHDGTVALENFGGVSTGTIYIPGSGSLGGDISDDHPVSFEYTTALASADGGLYNPTAKPSGIISGGTIKTDMLDSNNKLQCTSCHNPHDGTNGNFLIKSNTGSALCLTCHNMDGGGLP